MQERLYHKIYLIFLLIIPIISFSQDNKLKNVEIIINSEFDLISAEKKTISKRLRRKYKKNYNSKLRITDKLEKWNSTDILVRGLKEIYLICHGKSGENGFIIFNAGGIYFNRACLFYTKEDRDYSFIRFYELSDNVKDLQSLKDFLKSNYNGIEIK